MDTDSEITPVMPPGSGKWQTPKISPKTGKGPIKIASIIVIDDRGAYGAHEVNANPPVAYRGQRAIFGVCRVGCQRREVGMLAHVQALLLRVRFPPTLLFSSVGILHRTRTTT